MKKEGTLEFVKRTLTKNLFFALALVAVAGFTACSEDDEPAAEEEVVEGPEAPFLGTWGLDGAGALGVGPTQGSVEWWNFPQDAVDLRTCAMDDTFTFAADGVYTIDLGADTWLEGWQGVDEGCGAPVAPHVSGDYGFSVNEAGTELTITGEGAWIALAKVTNDGEDGVATSITFNVVSVTDTKMTLELEAGSAVWWTFNLAKK